MFNFLLSANNIKPSFSSTYLSPSLNYNDLIVSAALHSTKASVFPPAEKNIKYIEENIHTAY